MIRRTLLLSLLLLFSSSYSQQPQYLGSIPSDTTNSLFGSRILALGDQNQDGYDDILIWDLRNTGQLFLGGPSVVTTSVLRINDLRFPSAPSGDFNADGHLDFGANSVETGTGRYKMFFGGPGIDTVVDFRLGVDTISGVLAFPCVCEDINGNGSADPISGRADGFSRSVLQYHLLWPQLDSVPDLLFGSPSFLPPFRSIGDRVVCGDSNGDGSNDVALNWRPLDDILPGAALIYFGGVTFDTIPDLVIRRPGNTPDGSNEFGRGVLLSPGDLNADGYDDLVIGSSLALDDTLTFAFFGGPTIDTLPDVTFVEPIYVAASAGDVNNDGFADFIAGRPYPAGGWVTVHYGGPDFDSIGDHLILNGDIPGAPWEFGKELSGIGDYNGDGIDDFAVSGRDGLKGTVYIFTGFQDPTDVPYDYEPTLPSGYELAQNYPNPFNPTTTIQFALPAAGQTELEIYNILGERVTTLINRRLAAGSYSIEWDGTNAGGEPVASGIYLYHLQSGDYTTSRKMVLAR